jgi:type I restriction enzyme S subunit
MAISRWSKKPLKQLCYRIGDGLHGTPNYNSDSEIFFINGNNLNNGKIEITNNTNTVKEEDYSKGYIELNENSLLLSINGTLGSMAFYNNERIMLGKSAAYLNFKTGINHFYYYYFQLKDIQQYFYNVATGSTIKNLSLKSIQDFNVPVPSESEWKQIASVLSNLDAKIELNNRINRELEQMAKLLYDYWFVQFDFPDANGKPYKSSGGKMVWNKELKREIPEGWEVEKIGNVLKTSLGGTPSTEIRKYWEGGDFPWLN